MTPASLYIGGVRRGRYLVIAFWVGVIILGIFKAGLYLDATSGKFDPPSGTPAHTAKAVYDTLFAEKSNDGSAIVLVTTQHNRSFAEPLVQEALCNVTRVLVGKLEAYKAAPIYRSISGFCTTHGTNLSSLAGEFLSADKHASIISVGINEIGKSKVDKFMTYAVAATGTACSAAQAGLLSCGLTGTDALFQAAGVATKSSLFHTDSIIMPLALVILTVFLGSLPVMIAPLLCVVASVLLSFMLMTPVAQHWLPVSTSVPSIQTSLCLAISIDDTLFQLSRLREAIILGHAPENAISIMMRTSSLVVLVSGTTLGCSFLALVLLPVSVLKGLGLGAAAAMVAIVSVNLTLTPAILWCAPSFFSRFGLPLFLQRWYASRCGSRPIPDTDDETAGLLSVDPEGYSTVNSRVALNSPVAAHNQGSVAIPEGVPSPDEPAEVRHARTLAYVRKRGHRTVWYRLERLVTGDKAAVAVIVAVLLVVAVFAAEMGVHWKVTGDNNLFFPRNAPAFHVFESLKSFFSPGVVASYDVVLPTANNAADEVLTQDYFELTNRLAWYLTEHGVITLGGISAISLVGGRNVTLGEAQHWISGPSNPQSDVYRATFASLCNAAASASVIKITVPFDPLGDAAKPWILQTRRVLDAFFAANSNALTPAQRAAGKGAYLYGGNTVVVDTEDTVFRLFPYVIVACIVVVSCIMIVRFRSAFIPFRVLITLSVPIFVSMGSATVVFRSTGLYWLTVIVAAPICLGLGLDYDIFTMSRIVEYSRELWSDRQAAVLALSRVGSTILCAGVIMILSFGGLALSPIPMLTQLGYILAVDIFVDCFVVRPLLMPAITTIVGKLGANWWPSNHGVPLDE